MSGLAVAGLIWIAIAVVCAVVARLKGMNAFLWFGRGLAFGLLSLGYLLLTPGD
ncbi:MAG: hypothetical protein JSW34_10290 [Candidatus Zixiibacteriota bacterium]|nr:MAG: hypothetical protein JSW34_10290 [candidate division Zixibacteria bacterium]